MNASECITSYPVDSIESEHNHFHIKILYGPHLYIQCSVFFWHILKPASLRTHPQKINAKNHPEFSEENKKLIIIILNILFKNRLHGAELQKQQNISTRAKGRAMSLSGGSREWINRKLELFISSFFLILCPVKPLRGYAG